MRYVLGCVHPARKVTGGVFEPVEPPIEKPEEPTTPPSTEDLRTIKIEENIMAVVGTNHWYGIAYGNGQYVAVGASGYVTTSTDGVNWTTPKQVGTANWKSIAYGNGKFVAFNYDGYTSVSTNGTTWTTLKQIASKRLVGVTFGNEKFVVVGYDGYTSTSTDGTNWSTPVQAGVTDMLWFVRYCNGMFIAGGNGWYMLYSVDGKIWTKSNKSSVNNTRNSVAYGNGKYIMCGGLSTGAIDISTDCITWQNRTIKPVDTWRDIVYSNNQFVMVGVSGYIATSIDGEIWTTEQLKDESGKAVTTNLYGIVVVQ